MKIDIDAFMNSLPIMGVGLLGIFIVTIVIILGIYFLKAITPKGDASGSAAKADEARAPKSSRDGAKKESAMDLMNEREKHDFFDKDEEYDISHDL